MASLRQRIEGLTADGDDLIIDAPKEWAQGRTLYGGITAALSYGAVMRAQGDLGFLRSAQFSFIGPSFGQLRLSSQVLRRGRSSIVAGAECRTEDGIAARSLFVFGSPRDSAVAHDLVARHHVPPPDACEAFYPAKRPLPGFLGQFDYRLAAGSRAFQPGDRPEFVLWVRLLEPDDIDPVTALIAVADAPPCAAVVSLPKPAAVSTMTWSVDLHQPLAESGGWYLISSASEYARDGYSLQTTRVYNKAGVPLVSSRQVVAIFA